MNTCTHNWHQLEDWQPFKMPYCPACGERTDGRKTLANMPATSLSEEFTIEWDGCRYKVKFVGFEQDMMVLKTSDGNALEIRGVDTHNWFVVKDEADVHSSNQEE